MLSVVPATAASNLGKFLVRKYTVVISLPEDYLDPEDSRTAIDSETSFFKEKPTRLNELLSAAEDYSDVGFQLTIEDTE